MLAGNRVLGPLSVIPRGFPNVTGWESYFVQYFGTVTNPLCLGILVKNISQKGVCVKTGEPKISIFPLVSLETRPTDTLKKAPPNR